MGDWRSHNQPDKVKHRGQGTGGGTACAVRPPRREVALAQETGGKNVARAASKAQCMGGLE